MSMDGSSNVSTNLFPGAPAGFNTPQFEQEFDKNLMQQFQVIFQQMGNAQDQEKKDNQQALDLLN